MARYPRPIRALVLLATALSACRPRSDAHPPLRALHNALAITMLTVYPSPDAAPLTNVTVLIRDGRFVAIGPNVVIPGGTRTIPCSGCVATAGWWNAHVHFTEAKWTDAASEDSASLSAKLRDLAGQRGFTTLVDLGSDIRITGAIRRRIASGEIAGPTIYTAGSGIFPPNGIPYYLSDLPAAVRAQLPQPATPAEAVKIVERNIDRGADVVKLFTGSIVQRGTVLPMPVAIAKAAVDAAHEHHELAFAHPSDRAGTAAARDAGVDVLAHAPSFSAGIDSAFMKTLVDRKMWMIPTLKLYSTTVSTDSAFLQPIYREVRWFHELGGRFVFGTDVGYVTDYRTDDEFKALAGCGLSSREILRMLTTAPAELFGVAADRGTVEVGKAADLTVMFEDPMADPARFARVLLTVHDGEVLYEWVPTPATERRPNEPYWAGLPPLPTIPDSTWLTYRGDGFSFRYPKGGTVEPHTDRDEGVTGVRLTGPKITVEPTHPDTARGYVKRTGPSYELTVAALPNPSKRSVRDFVDSVRARWNERADEDYRLDPADTQTFGSETYLHLDLRCGDCQHDRYFAARGDRIVVIDVVYDISIPGEMEDLAKLYAAIMGTVGR